MDQSTSGSKNFEMFSCANVPEKRKCSYCGFETYLRISLNDHMWNHHRSFQGYKNTAIKLYRCENCYFTSYSLLVWRLHQTKCIFENFRQENKCLENPKKAEQISLGHNTMCLDTTSDERITLEHTLYEEITSRYIDSKWFHYCNLCKYKNRLRYYVRYHILKHTNPQYKYKCNQCLFGVDNKARLKLHVIREHTSRKENVYFKCSHIYKCSHCLYQTTLARKIKRHMLKHHQKIVMFECDKCEYKSERFDLLNRHKSKQVCELPSECKQCPYRTTSEERLTTHITVPKKIENGWFQCDQCEYKGKTKHLLSAHIKRKHPSGNQWYHTCDKCAYKALSKYTLIQHIISRHTDPKDIKWFQCDQCKFKAKTKTTLTQHIRVKHDSVCLKCNHCSYKTSCERSLTYHVIAHHTDPKDIKWFQCDQCKFKAKSKRNLTQHIRVKHDGAKANLVYLKCNQCSYKTSCKRSLTYHVIARHTDPKDIKWFHCDQCEYKAKADHVLRKHIRLKHPSGNKVLRMS